MSEPEQARPASRMRRAIGVQVLAIVVAAAVIAAAWVVGSVGRTTLAHQAFDASMTSMVHEVEADDNAHAALASAQASDFADSATKVTTALTTCLGSAATTQTTTDLKQLASFDAQPGAARAILPLVEPANTESAYANAASKLKKEVTAYQFRTTVTRADTQADLIAEDEVNRDLYGIATSVGGVAHTVTARYVYATEPVRSSYQQGVTDVASQVSILAPVIKSRSGVRISDGESSALIAALNTFASDCQSVAASSAAHKPAPAPAHVFYPRPFVQPPGHLVCTPGVAVNGIWVQWAYCTFVLD